MNVTQSCMFTQRGVWSEMNPTMIFSFCERRVSRRRKASVLRMFSEPKRARISRKRRLKNGLCMGW